MKRGTRFRHTRRLDPWWQPGPGQTHADAPKAVCVVTAVRGSRVYFRYDDGGRRGLWYFDIAWADDIVAEVLPAKTTLRREL